MTTIIIAGAVLAVPLLMLHVTINELDQADRIAVERELEVRNR